MTDQAADPDQALVDLEQSTQSEMGVARDQASGKVSSLRGRWAADAGDTELAARSFLARNAALLKLPRTLDDLVLDRRSNDLGGETIVFRQEHDGRRVFESVVLVGFDPTGAILHVENEYVSDIAVPEFPVITADEAIALAETELGTSMWNATAELVIVAGDKSFPGHHLAWEIAADLSTPRGDWLVFVEATHGDIVRTVNMLKRTGGDCVPCNPAVDVGCGRVFEHHPVDALNNTSLLDTSNVDAALVGCALADLTSGTDLTGTYANTSITEGRISPPYSALRSVSESAVDEVTVYYHLTRAKHYLDSIGFPSVMAFSIPADAHDPTLGDNAHFVPSGDYLEFGVGGVDDAQDPDVIYHEYGHAIQDNQVPGFGSLLEGGAMGEGFGDYFGAGLTDVVNAANLGAACIGGWDAVSYNPFTGAPTTGCLRRLDGLKEYPRDSGYEVHADGEMWSAALWRLRSALGASVADPLIVKSHTFLTPAATFISGANAVLSADVALNGGANAAAINDAFKLGGIPRSGTAGSATGLTNTVSWSCQTAHPYANLAYKECRVTQPGALRMRARFASFNTENGWDFVYVSDADYRQVQALSGTPFGGASGFSAVVNGDTLVVRFKADPVITRPGWTIDQYQYAPGCTDAMCNDGNACNGVETCQVNTCVPGTPLSCNDGNPCTSDSCDAASGCVNAPVANGGACDDGNVCNGIASCQNGSCSNGAPPSCDDGNPCTSDSCNAATGCATAPAPNGSPCDDGNVCNGVASCQAGTCTAGAPLGCNDGSPCTIDSCDPLLGCVVSPAADGTSCADSNACNGAETCLAGSCGSGAPLQCDDGNACTAEACNAASGCVSSFVATGTACGGGGTCNGAGVCTGAVCKSVKLTSATPGPLPSGTGALLTASGVVCGSGQTPEYRFLYRRNGGSSTYTQFRAWGTSPTATFNNTGLPSGKYTLQVLARSVGSTKNYESVSTLAMNSGNVCTSVAFSVLQPSPKVPGTILDLSASATCTEGDAEYQFLVKGPGATAYSVIRNWGGSAFAWDTTNLPLGIYNLQVLARGAGNTSDYESRRIISYTLADKCVVATVSTSPPSPALAGTTVQVQGVASCEEMSTPEFRFFYRLKGTSAYTELQPWSQSDSINWATSSLAPGIYQLRVDSRAPGVTTQQSTKTLYYTLQ